MSERRVLHELARDQVIRNQGRSHRQRLQALDGTTSAGTQQRVNKQDRAEIKAQCKTQIHQWCELASIGDRVSASELVMTIQNTGVYHSLLRTLLYEVLDPFKTGSNTVPLHGDKTPGVFYRMAIPFTDYTQRLFRVISEFENRNEPFELADISRVIQRDCDPTFAPFSGARASPILQFLEDKPFCPALVEKYHGKFRLTEAGRFISQPNMMDMLFDPSLSSSLILESLIRIYYGNKWD